MIINELVTKLSFNLDQRTINRYDSSMRRMERQAATATSNMHRSFSRSSSGIARMLNFNVRLHGVGSAISSLNKINSHISKVGSALKSLTMNMAVGGGLALAGGAVALGKNTFDTAMTMESLRSGLVTSEGSEKGAQKQFDRLSKFAAKFPATIDQVIKSYIQLKNLNLDSSEAAMIAYGNLAGATPGKKLKDVTAMIADATTFQFERIREFGMSYETFDDEVEFTFRGVKTRVKKNADDIQKWFISTIQKNFGGGMERQAKTIEGKMSNLSDAWMIAQYKMWEAGLKFPVHAIVSRLTEIIKKYTPEMIKFGKAADAWAERAAVNFHKLSGALKAVKPYIEPVAIGLGMIATHMIAMKGIAIAGGVLNFIGLLTSIGGGAIGAIGTALTGIGGFISLVSSIGAAGTFSVIGTTLSGLIVPALAAVGTFLTGGLIVGAIAALVALGVKLADYWARGDAALVGLRDKFPGLADGIKVIGDEMAAWWPIIQNVLIGGFNLLWPVIKWCFEGVLVPALGNSLKWMGMVSKWIRTAYEFWVPSLTNVVDALGKMFRFVWYEFIGPFFELLGGGVKNVTNAIGGMVNLLQQAAGMLPNAGGDAVSGQNVLGLTKNDTLATNLVNASRQVNTLKGQCLNAVWKVQQAALNGTSKITAYHAADAANQLASDKRFKEIKVTQAMLTDPKYIKLLHGATVIYNRQSGFSPVSGHAEIWDMVNKTANYGRGAQPLNRSAHMLANARVFIPASGSMPANTAAMYGPNGNANLTINVNASNSSNPELIKTKTKNGVTEALNKAKGLGNNATSPKRGTVAIAQ